MKRFKTVRVAKLSFSWRAKHHEHNVLVVLVLLTLAVLGMSLSFGSYPVPPLDIIKAILGLKTSDPQSPFVVISLRLPRVLLAWLVGIAFALSGTIMQGLTRNPLAEPGITGVSTGAGLAAVSVIVLFPAAPPIVLHASAFIGALLVALLLYLLAGTGQRSPLRLILVGVGLGVVAGSTTTLMLTFTNIYNVNQAMLWLAGSVSGKSWSQVWPLLLILGVVGSLAWLFSRHLNVLQLGEEVAVGVGSQVELQRSLLLLFSVALAGASVATAGTVGFVGLMAPHLARQLVGPMHEKLLPVAALIGGLILAEADFLGRTLFSPTELPCGLLTSILGGPYFLYLLARSRNGASTDK